MTNETSPDFIFENSGLVNLDSYLPYLSDSPEYVPLRAAKKNGSNPDPSRFVNQHIYFTESLYKQARDSTGAIDLRYSRLRTLPWSQIVMRKSDETRLHLDKSPFVELPPESTVEKTLQDYYDIDLVGAAILGIKELKAPKLYDPLAEVLYAPTEFNSLTKKDRVDIFVEERKKALKSLETPRATSQKFVASALKRLAEYLKDPGLHRVADEKLEGEKHFPLKVTRYGTFRNIGNAILLNAVGIKSIEESRTQIQVLQTGANRLKLVA